MLLLLKHSNVIWCFGFSIPLNFWVFNTSRLRKSTVSEFVDFEPKRFVKSYVFLWIQASHFIWKWSIQASNLLKQWFIFRYTAPEASWRWGFDPFTPLFFDLYHYLEQNGHFWLAQEHAPGPSRQVLPGCWVRHPRYSKNLFVRNVLFFVDTDDFFGQWWFFYTMIDTGVLVCLCLCLCLCLSHVYCYACCVLLCRSHVFVCLCLYHILREVGGWGRVPFSRNLMSPTPRRKWYLTTGRRAH